LHGISRTFYNFNWLHRFPKIRKLVNRQRLRLWKFKQIKKTHYTVKMCLINIKI
jgi:hypothetical protein